MSVNIIIDCASLSALGVCSFSRHSSTLTPAKRLHKGKMSHHRLCEHEGWAAVWKHPITHPPQHVRMCRCVCVCEGVRVCESVWECVRVCGWCGSVGVCGSVWECVWECVAGVRVCES